MAEQVMSPLNFDINDGDDGGLDVTCDQCDSGSNHVITMEAGSHMQTVTVELREHWRNTHTRTHFWAWHHNNHNL